MEGVFDPNAPHLTDEQTKSAMESNVVRSYPKVVRHKVDPPITGQLITNVSYMLLKQPQDGVYGFLKIRGTHGSDKDALQDAERIIKCVDSCSTIHQAHVGYWIPITNNEKYTLEKMDVKTQENDIALRDKATKENAQKNDEMKRQLQERKEKLETDTKNPEDPESLDYYTKQRVSKMELQKYIKNGEEKMKTLKTSLKKANKRIEKLNKKHPDYVKQWLPRYNEERIKVGLNEINEENMKDQPILGTID